MVFREEKLSDGMLKQLVSLSSDWEAEQSCYGYRKNEPADIEGNRVFAAYCEETLIGYLFGKRETAIKDTSVMPAQTTYFEVEELYVKPAHRSKGVGRRLFMLLEETMKGEGVEYILLSTATKNYRAVLHFYIDELEMQFWNARLFKRI